MIRAIAGLELGDSAMDTEREDFDTNKRLIERFTEECWNGGNVAAVPDMVAEDCRFHDPVFPHMADGVASLQRHIERVRRAFPDLRFTITEEAPQAGDIAVQWSASATQAAEFLGMHSPNLHASINGESIYRVREGKIVENWIRWNVMSLMKQLSCGKKPDAA